MVGLGFDWFGFSNAIVPIQEDPPTKPWPVVTVQTGTLPGTPAPIPMWLVYVAGGLVLLMLLKRR